MMASHSTKPQDMVEQIYPQSWLQIWQWNGMDVSLIQTNPQSSETDEKRGSTVVLIHGFGANKEHWRHNVESLANERQVVGIDLIGFGSSEKPRSRLKTESHDNGWVYSIDNWSQQVVDLIQAKIKGSVQLIGNSIGGVVALNAARILEEKGEAARQVILIDCAQRALDDKRLSEQPLLRRLGRPALKALVQQRWLTRTLFQTIARPGLIRKVLEQAYPSKNNVDTQLIHLLLQPALQANADEAFRGFINLFEDRLATDLLEQLKTPVAMLCGDLDPWEPVEEAMRWTKYSSVKSIQVLNSVGHCPHDEAPEMVNPLLLDLLREGDL